MPSVQSIHPLSYRQRPSTTSRDPTLGRCSIESRLLEGTPGCATRGSSTPSPISRSLQWWSAAFGGAHDCIDSTIDWTCVVLPVSHPRISPLSNKRAREQRVATVPSLLLCPSDIRKLCFVSQPRITPNPVRLPFCAYICPDACPP